MKLLLCFGMLTLLTIGAAPAISAQEGEDSGLLKIGLVLREPQRHVLDSRVLTTVTQAFQSSRRFTVAERDQLDKILAEQDLAMIISGKNSDLSDLLQLDYLGLVTYLRDKKWDPIIDKQVEFFRIDVQLTDVTTGAMVENVSSLRIDLIDPPVTPEAAGQHLLANIREAFPPEGYLIKIDGSTAVVDLGSQDGLEKGLVLEVVRQGESIIHPVTGKLLGGEDVIVGKLKVKNAMMGMATCKIAKKGDFQVRDRVRLKRKDPRTGKWIDRAKRFRPRFGGKS